MRRMFYGIFLTAILAPSVYAASDACQHLAKAVDIAFEGLPKKVAAGGELKFVVKSKILNEKILKNWQDIVVYIAFSNNVLGSRSLDFELQIKDNGVLQATTAIESKLVPMNMAGNYHAMISIFGLRGNPTYCGEHISDDHSSGFEVMNAEESTDIYPPAPSNFSFEKSDFDPGETIVVSFDAEDKSGICTKDLEDQQKCRSVPHVELTNMNGGRDINFFSARVIRKGERYQLSFSLPNDADAGAYELTIVNIYDLWQNAFAHLSEDQRISMKVMP